MKDKFWQYNYYVSDRFGWRDAETIFGKMSPHPKWLRVLKFWIDVKKQRMHLEHLTGTDMLDICVMCNAFPSKSEARRQGWKPEIEDGFNEYDIGKIYGHLKRRVYIWKPRQ